MEESPVDNLRVGDNPCQSHPDLGFADRHKPVTGSVTQSEHDNLGSWRVRHQEDTPHRPPVSILRSSTTKMSADDPHDTACPPESASSSQSTFPRRCVHFSDGSSPGLINISEDEHRKVPCYEPSPSAISEHVLNLPNASWEDLLRHSSDINSLKTLLDQSVISHKLEPVMDDIE